MRAVSAACAALLLLGCSRADTPAALHLVVNQLDFGPVEIDGSASRAIALSNSGTLPGTVRAFRWESSSAALTFTPPATTTVEGGAVVPLRFTYAPSSAEVVTATLTIDADGLAPIVLRGHGVTLGYRIDTAASTCEGRAGSISLGAADGTAPARQTVRLLSVGTGPIQVAARLDRPHPGLSLDPPVFDRTIAPGEAAELTVAYDPDAPAALDAALVLTTNALAARGQRVPLCATASFARLCARPSALDLGTVPPGTTARERIDLVNCGTEPLAVSAVELATDAQHLPTPGFSVSSSVPPSLAPGVGAPVWISLAPPGLDPSQAWVRVASSAPKTPEVFVPVTAQVRRPCSLAFAPDPVALRAGIEPEREVRVTNVGGGDCTLDRLELTPAQAALHITRAPALPATLSPGSALAFGVAYDGSTREVRSRATVTASDGSAAGVDVIGDPSVPAECFLTVAPALLDFGLVSPGQAMSSRFEVVNHGRRDCRLRSAALTPTSDRRFRFEAGHYPVTLRGGQSLFVNVGYEPTGNTVAHGRVELETDDDAHPLLAVTLIAGRQGCGDRCECGEEETLTFWRFDTYGAASAIEPANGGEAFARSCDVARCGAGQVAVEVARNTFECLPPPPACMPDEGVVLDESGATHRLVCGRCDVIIHFGALYDNVRLCAESPSIACTSGRTPTFDVRDHEWQCQATCNNGAYDRHDYDGQLVCVPC